MDVIPTTPISLYNLVAATTALLCEVINTLPREVVYIWSYHRKTNWITLFYMITRYLPCVTLLSLLVLSARSTFLSLQLSVMNIDKINNSLLHFMILYNVPWLIMLICTEILFIKRTAALQISYHGRDYSTLTLRILFGFFIIEMAATIISFIIYHSYPIILLGLKISSGVLDGGPAGVNITPVPSFPTVSTNSYYAFPGLIFQAILVLLVSKKALSNWKAKVASEDLISILVRDGLWSFLVNLCGILFIVMSQSLWFCGPAGLPNLLWSYVSFSITSTRLIVNIRAAAARRAKADEITTLTAPNTRLSFVQGIRSFITSGNEELSEPYHFSDFENDSDTDECDILS